MLFVDGAERDHDPQHYYCAASRAALALPIAWTLSVATFAPGVTLLWLSIST